MDTDKLWLIFHFFTANNAKAKDVDLEDFA